MAFLYGTTKKPLHGVHRALIRLSWRVYHRHLTKVSMDGTFFRPKQVIKEIAWLFASRLQAYQAERNSFYWKRKHSPKTTHLPRSTLQTIAPFGDMDLETGTITFNEKLVVLLRNQGAWKVEGEEEKD